MLFNSLEFALFFVIVYGLYLVLGHRGQNRVLLVASYLFYGAWDWRFLSLIFISTVVDYYAGLKIAASRDRRLRSRYLFCSVFVNLSILGFFKYFNFFAENLYDLLSLAGFSADPFYLRIILPVGISFYTFQTMSYTLDIYRGKLEPTDRFLDFALFVSFFPQLVAGPVERARNLLPQILKPRRVSRSGFFEGFFLISWGLFEKVFIADNLARIVDHVFATDGGGSGAMVLLASYAFAFQIFCDFDGYSNIARGIGKCLGFEIMINFNLPYFACNPSEFWSRWHISLSSWLRDYLYIPLGGNRGGEWKTYRNLAITMLLGGLWHGASWTFVIWGAYHGLLLIAHRAASPLLGRVSPPKSVAVQKTWKAMRILFFFQLTCLGWLIFRAESFDQLATMLGLLVANFSAAHLLARPEFLASFLFTGSILWAVQLRQYLTNDLMIVYRMNPVLKTVFYFVCLMLVILFGVYRSEEFLYFQF